MKLCRICGEEGHLAARCKELGMPPDELYTGPSFPGSGEDHDHTYWITSFPFDDLQHIVQAYLTDDGIQSKQPVQI